MEIIKIKNFPVCYNGINLAYLGLLDAGFNYIMTFLCSTVVTSDPRCVRLIA